MTRTRRSWKRHESAIAEKLGGTRNPCTGGQHSDVDAGPFAAEVKLRRSLPQWIHDAVDQAARSAGERTPIVVLVESRQGIKARRYVLLRFEDFVDWHGSLEMTEVEQ